MYASEKIIDKKYRKKEKKQSLVTHVFILKRL